MAPNQSQKQSIQKIYIRVLLINISAVAKHLITLNTDVEIVCAGRNNYFSIEDSVCAGMLISKISKVKTDSYLNDSGAAVLTLYEKYGANLLKMMRESDHGKILIRKWI
ncbi:MAG: 2-phosphosulfolactate phosphatase [Ignavibacteriales bacterium]|nr:2-phosphosulfolactate phosphatase [Ignavibacteriales bacterium]